MSYLLLIQLDLYHLMNDNIQSLMYMFYILFHMLSCYLHQYILAYLMLNMFLNSFVIENKTNEY
ncbi:MAG: hypothetical protein CMI60_02500 [Parvibaculum sp.]|nr:hypothetical protein [Parvibaculum sp.]